MNPETIKEVHERIGVMVAQKEAIRCPVSLKSQILLKRLTVRVPICRTFYSYCILQRAYILFQY